eukprot:s1051_g10.t1
MGKKLNDPDSFTGILLQEDFVPVNDYEIGLAAATDVYEDLPEGAETFDPEWQDLGRCCEGWDEKDFVCEVGFGVQGTILECDCFLSQVPPLSISFSGHLTQKLLQCCRKHDVPCATVVAEPHRATAVNSTDLKQSDLVPESPDLKQSEAVTVPSAEIFTAEEADDEAIIDTGASRAAIGMERLRKLMSSLPSEVSRKVMKLKVPTDGVVFKFGNSGRLTSDFAVMLPRAQKGWLRIEVVQGQTPFLISSAVLKGLKAVVDVEGKTLGFRDSGVRIPLVNVRKNLLGVKVMDLLSMAPHVQSAQTHILCAPVIAETNEQNQTDSQHDHGHAHKLHHMHDFHDGIHHTVPKERAVNDDQGKDSVNQQDLSLSAAHFSEQGYLKAPSGKHVNKTYAAIYEQEPGYVNQMWNRRGVSSWVRSFQLYCRERRAASQEAKRRMAPLTQGSSSATQMPVVPKASAPVPQQTQGPLMAPAENAENDGWIRIPVETPVPEENVKGKRSLANPTPPMETQPDPEKVQRLQAQIAILQRELQKETKGSQSSNKKP